LRACLLPKSFKKKWIKRNEKPQLWSLLRARARFGLKGSNQSAPFIKSSLMIHLVFFLKKEIL
jgi:hypothetical protein